MNPAAATVSIVIPNWNGMEHLSSCLESVRRQTYKAAEVILVDNGSTDGSTGFIKTSFPEVILILFGTNRGFAAAVNRGIETATGDIIALLNNDIELEPQWLERAMSGLLHHKEAGSAACKMLRYDNRTIIDAVGDGLTRGANPLTRGAGMHQGAISDREEFIFGACAGAALYKKGLFTSVGTFDESFISYYEDADLAFRSQLAGFKCIYVPSAVCYHKRGATAKKMKAHYPIRMQERNLTAFHIKNIPAMVLLRRFPVILASRIRRLFRLTLSGLGVPAWSGLLEGLALIPEMIRKRKIIQSQRTVSCDYILSFMRRES